MTATAAPARWSRAADKAAARRRPSQRWLITSLLSLPVPILFLVTWHVGITYQWELPFGIRMAFLPYPTDVAVSLADFAVGGIRDDAFSGQLWGHLGASIGRVAAGFGLATALAVPLGILMGRFYVVHALFDVMISSFRPIPATAWVPLVMLLIGYGDQSTIFLIALSAFFPILLGTISGAREVSPRLVEAAQMLGSKPAEVLYKIIVPASAPAIINGLRIGLGLAWVVLVIGEIFGITEGLGATIALARDLVRTDLIVVGMICIAVAGFLSDRLLVGAFRLVFGRRPLIR